MTINFKVAGIFLVVLALFTATEAPGQDRYVLQVKDKNNSPFSFSNPSAYLSPRSIQRRVNQGIPLDSTDLPVNPAYVGQVAAAGAKILGVSRWLNTLTIEATSPAVLTAVNGLPFISSVSNVGRSAGGMGTPAADKFALERIFGAAAKNASNHKSASFDYGLGLNQIAMLGGDIMHNNGFTAKGYIIAVIDAGFYRTDSMMVFDSLFANGQVLATYDFVDNNANVYDDGSHGTYVLSTMAANWTGVLVGTAPAAEYLLLRSEYGPTELIIEEYDWAEAAEYADSAGADVINSSLSYTEFDDSTQNHTYLDMNGDATPVTRAADMAAAKGMVVCNSAGNAGTGAWFFVGAPADADSILTVGGVDSAANYIPFSSKGPTADGRIKPDVVAQAFETYVAELFDGGAIKGNGTSFSSPIMAGLAACLWQCHPSATNMQIIEALRQSGSQASSPDSLMGYGVPDLPLACLLLSSNAPPGAAIADALILTGPNPFTESIEFAYRFDSLDPVIFSVNDLTGRVAYQKIHAPPAIGIQKFSIPTAGFSGGMYLLSARSPKNYHSKKIIRTND